MWKNHCVFTFLGSTDTQIHKGGQYKTISLGDIFSMQPQSTEKAKALAFVPSNYHESDARSADTQKEKGKYVALTIDIDGGNLPLEVVRNTLQKFAGDSALLVYSSSSASNENKKWRGVIPLKSEVNFQIWQELQLSMYAFFLEKTKVEPDVALSRANQPVYLQNVPAEFRDANGIPLFYQSEVIDGQGLSMSSGLVRSARDAYREKKREEETAIAAARAQAKARREARQAEYGTNTNGSLIDDFNSKHTVEEMLLSNGYDRDNSSSDWRSPYQSSKSFATRDYGDYWISLSASDAAAKIGREVAGSKGCCFGDAFDLWCHFEHGGDVKAAVAALGAEKRLHEASMISIPAPSRLSAIEDFGIAPEDEELLDLMWPHLSGGKNPKPLNTIENFTALSKFLRVNYRMNMMTGEEIVTIPDMNVAEGCEANSAVTYMMSQANLSGMPSSLVPEYMAMLCAQNPFHPAQQWVDSVAWDGVSRIQEWMDTIEARDQKLKEQMLRRWALSAIAALYKPGGVSAHGVLTLLGDQGIGKTSWFLSLVPRGMGFAKDGMILRPDSPDSVRQVTSSWLVELGELDATFRKSDIAALKAFITQNNDTYRLPYARKNTVNPRRTVFFASVNDPKFLSDNTGNRRYWTIDCVNINYKHDIDMQQFWAEIKTLYQAGESWFLNGDELAGLNESNEEFMAVDPIKEMLQTKLDWDADKSLWSWKTATEVCQMISMMHPSRADATRVGVVMKKDMGCPGRKSHGKMLVSCPPAKTSQWF